MPIPFRPIARLLTSTLHPPPLVDKSLLQPSLPLLEQGGQGALFTVNHYSAPDFKAWWISITISAVIPAEVHWVVTSEWTNSGWRTGFTHWLFPRGARLLGFTAMPAMPPNPVDTEARAAAVRHTLDYASRAHAPVVGIAPEGRDMPGGVLGELPRGVGRFIYSLAHHCHRVVPVGIWKENGRIHLVFGKPYTLEVPEGLSADKRDAVVGNMVMERIAALLPERLRGAYK